ncbi:hypothetical protein Scep_001349 [Stephania cephalantha]|uniref:Uncharacterized protein n=1 Tax=Stephania cephalantha TaxID=152367 RepID=A0AAP0L966_9MAGN
MGVAAGDSRWGPTREPHRHEEENKGWHLSHPASADTALGCLQSAARRRSNCPLMVDEPGAKLLAPGLVNLWLTSPSSINPPPPQEGRLTVLNRDFLGPWSTKEGPNGLLDN